MNKVAVCAIAKNEARFADDFVRSAKTFADTVVVLDTGSTDETPQILRAAGAMVFDYSFKDFLTHGFGHTRTALIEKVPKGVTWLHWLDIDERVTEADGHIIKNFSGDSPRFIETRTFPQAIEGFDIKDWRRHTSRPYSGFRHLRSHPHLPGFQWRGYIHEELYVGDTHAYNRAVDSPVAHWHFTNMNPRQDYPKQFLYGFFLDRGVRHPELQKYTNGWWYSTHVKTLPVAEQARIFREMCPDARDIS